MKTKALRTVLFFLIIIIIPAFTLFGEKETVSYNENKTLAEFPTLSFQSYKNRSFMKGVSAYFSDHFVLREQFIKIKNQIDKSIGKNEINGVFEIDGSLFQTFRNVDYTLTDRNITALNKLKSRYPETPFDFMLVPTAQEMLKNKLPKYIDVQDESEYNDYCVGKLSGIEAIDVSREIAEKEYAYYRTDHHWTSFSAFAAYTAAGQKLGYTPLPESAFSVETVTSDFKGTLYSKTLNENIKPDSISVYRTETDFTLTVKDKKYDSLYFEEYLSQKDKFLYFLGGNYEVCSVKNNTNRNGRKLLIIKDSYANEFIPLIAEHFEEITVIDPRYCSLSLIKEINPSEYDRVLVLFNVLGFSQEQNFSLIEFTGDNQ